MTDHQQAALTAMQDEIYRQLNCQYGDFNIPSNEEVEAILAAAEPHLRKKWAEEIREKVIALSGFHPQVYGERGSGFNDCRSLVLDLLEGAGE